MDSEDEIAEIEEQMGGAFAKFKFPRTIYEKKMINRHGWIPVNEPFSSTVQETNELLNDKFQTSEGMRLIRNNNVRISGAVRRINALERTEQSLRRSIANHRQQTNMTEQAKIREINLAREASFQLMQQKTNLRNLKRTKRILTRNSFTLGFWD